MTPQELEQRLKAEGGKVWGQYKRRKEGFITSVVTRNAEKGVLVSRAKAQEIWFRKMVRVEE